MQPISDGMRAALTAAAPVWDFGADLLDDQDRAVGDLTGDLLSLSVSRDTYADVPGRCTLQLTRDLAWGRDRVRPWIAVAEGEDAEWHRWPLGVFLPTSPEQVAGEAPRTRQVSGVDKLWLLQRKVGNTYVVPVGTSYLDAIRGVLTDAGLHARLLLDGDRQATLLDEPAVWPLLETGGYTWLDIINKMLEMIGYDGLWADHEGRFRSGPSRPATERGSAWVFDTTDVLKGVVGEDRRLAADVYGQPNVWRFIRKKDRALTDQDVYDVPADRGASIPPEQRRPQTVYLDVADRAALVSEGDRIVAEDTQDESVVSFSASALPLTHADVVMVRDPDLGLSTRALVRRWSITDDGSMDVECEVL